MDMWPEGLATGHLSLSLHAATSPASTPWDGRARGAARGGEVVDGDPSPTRDNAYANRTVEAGKGGFPEGNPPLPQMSVPDSTDPRMTDDFVHRSSAGDGGDVTLVGVVHDHAASTYRVQSVVEATDPDVVALELPRRAVSLFEQYADDDRTPPVFGGEMSAAIQAASTDRVVGVDGPTRSFLGLLARNLYRERASPSTLRRVARGVLSVTRHALLCQVAGGVAARTSLRVEVDSPVSHDARRSDDPRVQADDERSQVRRARAVMDAFEPSRAARFRDATREEYMADRLSTLRREGDVVAVVGIDHLEPLAERLDGRT